jgi:hypothetical protein
MKDILATLPNIDTPYGKMLTISPTSPKDISLLEAYNVKLASPMKGQRTILKESFTLPSIRPNFQITGVKESITHSARKNCPGSSFDGTLNKSKSLNSLGQDTARRSMKWNRGFKVTSFPKHQLCFNYIPYTANSVQILTNGILNCHLLFVATVETTRSSAYRSVSGEGVAETRRHRR